MLLIVGRIAAWMLVAIGLVLSLQPVSLLTGDGILWVAAALAVAGVIVTFIPGLDRWTKVFVTLIAIFVVANTFYVDNQLRQQPEKIRQQIQHDLQNFSAANSVQTLSPVPPRDIIPTPPPPKDFVPDHHVQRPWNNSTLPVRSYTP